MKIKTKTAGPTTPVSGAEIRKRESMFVKRTINIVAELSEELFQAGGSPEFMLRLSREKEVSAMDLIECLARNNIDCKFNYLGKESLNE